MKSYFKLLLALYFAALAVCGACRVYLKLFQMDFYTGFYTGGAPYVTAFNIMLAAVPVTMFATNRLKKPDDDYPVDNPNRVVSVLSLLTGIAVAVFAIIGAPESGLRQGHGIVFYQIRAYATWALGELSAIALMYLGISGVFGRKRTPPGLLIIIPSVWQIVLLVTRYNAYTTVTAISDHLLLVLFMIFNSLFLMGMARTVSSQMRRDGRNYAIPSGLCASLCGFLLVVPNFVYILLYRAPMPVLLLGYIESLYIFMMSVFALVFVTGLMRSIKRV